MAPNSLLILDITSGERLNLSGSGKSSINGRPVKMVADGAGISNQVLIQVPADPASCKCTSEGSRWLKWLGPCHQHWRCGQSSWLLASDWHKPSCWGHLGSQQIEDLFHCLSSRQLLMSLPTVYQLGNTDHHTLCRCSGTHQFHFIAGEEGEDAKKNHEKVMPSSLSGYLALRSHSLGLKELVAPPFVEERH